MLRLKDVATIEFDSEDYNMISMTDGKPSASIMIKQRPGSNAREVIQQIKAKMEELKETTFAPGMEYNISYDVSRFLDCFHIGRAQDLAGGVYLGIYRGVSFLAGFPVYVDTGYRRSGIVDRYVLLYADAGFLRSIC